MSEVSNVGFNTQQAWEWLGVSKAQFYRLLKRGEFPNAYKVGSRGTRIPLLDLKAYREKTKISN